MAKRRHAKTPLEKFPATPFGPFALPRNRWRPNDMTPEQSASMDAAGRDLGAAWLVFEQALEAAKRAQATHQGNLSTGAAYGAADVKRSVQDFMDNLCIAGRPNLPEAKP